MSVSKSIGKATMWSFAAEIAAKLITPITNIILARILAPEAFGIIATINMVVSLADTFSTAGFQKYVIQHKIEEKLTKWSRRLRLPLPPAFSSLRSLRKSGV